MGGMSHGYLARPVAEGRPLTHRETEALAAYALTGDRRLAARQLGISDDTQRKHLLQVYRKLGARNAIDALRAVGWLHVPI